MQSRNRLGKLLTDGRRRKRLTQVQLAQRLNVGERTVVAWETGRNIPHPVALEKLALELSLDINLLKAERWDERERRRRARERRAREEDAMVGAVA